MAAASAVRLIVDGNLGRLARWLRALGCDAAIHEGRADRHMLRRASENRIAVRNAAACSRRSGGGVIITAVRWDEQLARRPTPSNFRLDDRAILGPDWNQ